MAVKNNGKKKLSSMFEKSKICGFFYGIASYLYDKAGSSIVGKFFSGYKDKNDVKDEKGLFRKASDKADLSRRVYRPVKRVTSKLVSQSVILKLAQKFMYSFLSTAMNIYGLFFMTAGIGFLAVTLLKTYVLSAGELSFGSVFIASLLILTSIPLLFSKRSLKETVCRSRLASLLIFDWLGGKRAAFENEDPTKGDGRLALVTGLLMSSFSWWYEPLSILFAIALCVFAITVLYIPETGVVCLLLCMPFLPSAWLNPAIIYIGSCYVMKCLRGKRTFRFDNLSITIFLFGLVFIFNGMSPNGYDVNHVFYNVICGMSAFFLVINLIKSRQWLDRCLNSLCVSGFIVVIIGLLRYSVSRIDVAYLTSVFRCAENEQMVSVFGDRIVFTGYLMAVMPFMLVGIFSTGKFIKHTSFWGYAAGLVCLYLSHDHRAWICFILGLVVFMVLYGKKSLAWLMAGACTLPFVCLNLPNSVNAGGTLLDKLSRFVSESVSSAVGIGGNAVSFLFGAGIGSFDYLNRISRIRGGLFHRLFTEIGFVGLLLLLIGVFFAFQKNTTMYSKDCSVQGKRFSLGALAAVTSLLSVGLDVDIFTNNTTTVLFWIALGLASCVSGTESIAKNVDDPDQYEEFDVI